MFKEIFKNYIYPASVFSGGVVGVGFLSLPYVIMKSGIWLSLAYFISLTAIIIIVNLIFCDISLRTPDFKRFPGFVGYHLGKKTQAFVTVLIIFGAIGVLLAYLLVGVEFLTTAFQTVSSSNTLLFVLVLSLIMSAIIYFDIRVVSRAEFWVLSLLIISLVVVFFNSLTHIKLDNIFLTQENGWLDNLFLPYGALLFALWGVGLIPEVEEMIRGNKKRLKKIIAVSTILISVFYFLFAVLILSITGKQTSPIALVGLESFVSKPLFLIALFAGLLGSITAFITQGLILKKTLIFDLKIKHSHAFIITCCAPLILFLSGFNSFISLISFIGAFLVGIYGILILLMYKKIGEKNKFLIYILSLVFLLGIVYELIYFIK